MPRRAAGTEYRVARGILAPELVDGALRLLHLDLLQRGATADTLADWLWSAHWFPHLNHHPAVVALAEALPPGWTTGTLCDPQIILQFPHVGPDPDITFHVDEEPHWAQARRYLRIVGVPLSSWREENGGLLVRLAEETVPVELDPGDAVMMTPDLPHSGGVNRTGSVRYGIYFRWLDE
ncbi:MAG TPA: phytanoyl-CoA dioxygenase family protein [Solirubrobacteraceae bacterium]